MTARRPIQVRLALGALVLLIGIVTLLGTSQVITARNSQRQQIQNGELTAAHLASSALASALASRLQLISNLASQPQLAALFTASNAKQQAKIAAALHLLYPGFASFDVISATGRLDARWPSDPQVIGKDISSNSFYTEVIRTKRPYISEALQQSAPPSELVVGLAAPVTDKQGNIVGILQGTLPAATIGSIIGGTSLRGGGQLVIVDQAGHAITGPAASAARSFMTLAPIKSALAGKTGAADAAVPGFANKRLLGYAPVPSVGWAVIAENPHSTLDTPLTALTVRLVGIGLLVLLLALGTALLVGMLLRRLSREHDQAGALLGSVGEGVATLSPAGSPMLVSPALERLIGHPASALIGRPWSDTISLYDQGGQQISWDDSIAAQAIRDRQVVASTGYELHLARADGQRVPVLLTASPLLAGNELLGAVIVLRDVSREREVDQLKSSLVSTVSHELRTPLTMIQGFSELLVERGNLGADRSRDALQQIHSSSMRLGRLIDDLLSVARIDSGKLTASIGPVDLSAVISEVTNTFNTDHPGRIQPEIEPDLQPLLADRDKTVQVLTNLVSNAVKYSPESATVRIAAKSKGNYAEVSVIDQGIGLTSTETARMFEKFSRADRPEVRKVSGTGLGLYISKSLVELMRGQLWVTSTPDVGSSFSISLPFAPSTEGETSPTQEEMQDAHAAYR